jgi:hypothetical protein
MNLVDQWKVGGPVRTIRSELAEWDLAKEQWQAARRVTMVQFRPDGCISEMENHNPNGSISRSRYSYDEAGRLLESIFHLAQLFNPQKAMWSTTYHYDDRGCQIERCTWIGGLKQSRTTWEYDEHDNAIREIEQDTVGGGLQTDESGKLQFINEKLSNHEVRYEYKYDSHGNWTERVVSMRYETNLDLQRSNNERREINYYPST